jgi:hypothetical protein
MANFDLVLLYNSPADAVCLDLVVALIFQARVQQQVIGAKRSLDDMNGILRLPGEEHQRILTRILRRPRIGNGERTLSQRDDKAKDKSHRFLHSFTSESHLSGKGPQMGQQPCFALWHPTP